MATLTSSPGNGSPSCADPGSVLRCLIETAFTRLGFTERHTLQRLAELLDQSETLRKLAQCPVGHAEPIFVLRGQDLLAGMTVRHWAALAAQYGSPASMARLQKKLRTAPVIADAMEAWPNRRLPGHDAPDVA